MAKPNSPTARKHCLEGLQRFPDPTHTPQLPWPSTRPRQALGIIPIRYYTQPSPAPRQRSVQPRTHQHHSPKYEQSRGKAPDKFAGNPHTYRETDPVGPEHRRSKYRSTGCATRARRKGPGLWRPWPSFPAPGAHTARPRFPPKTPTKKSKQTPKAQQTKKKASSTAMERTIARQNEERISRAHTHKTPHIMPQQRQTQERRTKGAPNTLFQHTREETKNAHQRNPPAGRHPESIFQRVSFFYNMHHRQSTQKSTTKSRKVMAEKPRNPPRGPGIAAHWPCETIRPQQASIPRVLRHPHDYPY